MRNPVFVTFTGVDEKTSLNNLAELSGFYPVEFGVLFSPKRTGVEPRYPSLAFVEHLVRINRTSGIRLSAHLCGGYADAAIAGVTIPELEPFLRSFTRVQVNTTARLYHDDITRIRAFASSRGLVPIVQYRDINAGLHEHHHGVQWLYDNSCGSGTAPVEWPKHTGSEFHGFAGGINPHNARAVTAIIGAGDGSYWLDMESGVRNPDTDEFSTIKCAEVCEEVYGAAGQSRPESGPAVWLSMPAWRLRWDGATELRPRTKSA